MAAVGDYVVLATPGGETRTISLASARVLIGRAPGSDIEVSDSHVSRRHARLEREVNGHWRIIDLGSSNGTLVNNQRIQVTSLADGDVVTIGGYTLTLHSLPLEVLIHDQTTSTMERMVIFPSAARSMVVEPTEPLFSRAMPASLLASVHDAERRLGRATDVPSLIAVIAQQFRAILHPKRLVVGREDGPKCEWPLVLGADGQPADGSDLHYLLVPRVAELRTSVVLSWNDPPGGSEAGGTARRDAQSLLFPISSGGRRLGHVYAELGDPQDRADDQAVELLCLLTRQAALIWENLGLQAARRAAEQFTRELSAARQIQLHLLPETRVLDFRLDIAAENMPALAVSGDYYDYQLLEPGRVAFVIADVMGHGLPAGILMASVQPVFRTGVRAGWDLLRIDQHIHETVAACGRGETFVTGILGTCDLNDGRISLLAAGHTWPSIWCGDTQVPRDPRACSPPWGLPLERSTTPAAIPLPDSNWSIVAFTDGLTDSLTVDGTSYGAARLASAHERLRDRPADEMCDEILTDVIGVSDDSFPQQDDMTLLVLRDARSGLGDPLAGKRSERSRLGVPADEPSDPRQETDKAARTPAFPWHGGVP